MKAMLMTALKMMVGWGRVDIETPAILNPLWDATRTGAITLKPLGIFYRNGFKTECKQRHEGYHWDDIPNPYNPVKTVSWLVWYTTYVTEAISRWAANGFKPYTARDHSKERIAYLIEDACEGELDV